MFDLKAPCGNCPFRKSRGPQFALGADRIDEIAAADAFQCHKTVNYDEAGDPVLKQGVKPQQCAGLMAMLHAEERPNLITSVAVALIGYDPSCIDTSDTYDSIDAAKKAHRGRSG